MQFSSKKKPSLEIPQFKMVKSTNGDRREV